MKTVHRTGGSILLTALILAGWTAETAAAGTAVQDMCPRHVPVMGSTPGTEHDEHDVDVAPEVARRVSEFMRDRAANVQGTVDTYFIPGHPGHLVASEVGIDGLRLVHLVNRNGVLTELWTGPGLGETWVLKPVFFRCEDRIVILAYTGDYYSWGLAAYEFRSGKMERLGDGIDVGVDPPPEPPVGGPLNPLPYATVRTPNGQLVVEFAADLVLRPGSRNEEIVGRSGADPLRFVYRRGQFVLTSGGGE